MLISDIFVTIQGEGWYLGVPSVFVRTSGCNLRCEWSTGRCDTPYTSWEPTGRQLSVAAVLAEVAALRATRPHLHHVVITGGEPLLQATALLALTTGLKAAGAWVTLETNGTRKVAAPFDFVSLSPKLASSTPQDPKLAASHQRRRLNLTALRWWLANYAYQLKFVVDSAADEAEIVDLLSHLPGLTCERIFIMPQGVQVSELHDREQLCLDLCLRHGWRYTPRTHIELFGHTRAT